MKTLEDISKPRSRSGNASEAPKFPNSCESGYRRIPILQCALVLRYCIVIGFGLLSCSAANGQTETTRPQPDLTPEIAVTPSPAQIIAEFDVDKNRQLDQQELENVLSLLFQQIQTLQREVQELKSQLTSQSAQPPQRHVTRKVPLRPSDDGVYAGKYFPPPSSDK